MDAATLSLDERDGLLCRCDSYRKAFEQILNEMGRRISPKRIQLALSTLGINDAFLLRANSRLKHAAYNYLFFADRRKGSTIFEAWHKDHLKRSARSSATFTAMVDALAKSRFSAFIIERVHIGLGVEVRDVVTGDQLFLVDRLMAENWKIEMQFAGRIAILPEFAMLITESLESAVTPGAEFTGGQLSDREQAKLQAVVIQMFRDALLSC